MGPVGVIELQKRKKTKKKTSFVKLELSSSNVEAMLYTVISCANNMQYLLTAGRNPIITVVIFCLGEGNLSSNQY